MGAGGGGAGRPRAGRRQGQIRARGRAGAPVTVAPVPQRIGAAIRDLDLETKVADDALRGRLSALQKQVNRGGYVTFISAAVDQIIDTFHPENSFLRGGLRALPLLAVKTEQRPWTVESIVTDPRVLGGGVIGGLTLYGYLRDRGATAHRVSLTAPSSVQVDGTTPIIAQVLDRDGRPMDVPVTWRVDNIDRAAATIEPRAGTTIAILRAGSRTGAAIVTASADGLDSPIPVEIVYGGGIISSDDS